MGPRVCVIGAGMSGMVTARHLREEGLDFDWFEKTSEMGGVWSYREDPGVFSIYECCRTIGCKHTMELPDHPIPEGMEEYPTHREYLDYLLGYVDRFDLESAVTFDAEVVSVERRPDAGWRVGRADGEDDYDHVVVTTGQFRYPMVPRYHGSFVGDAVHSAHYRTAEPFEGRTVLVVGMGNSGVDIACDVAPTARRTLLSTRRGAHVIPKHVLGRPFLHFHAPVDDYLPFTLNQVLTHLLAWIGRGRLKRHGVPSPDHPILLKNPTLSDTILDAVREERVEMKPGIAALDGDGVRFDDGSREQVDSIVWATGYQTRFPFFDPALVSFRRGRFENYLHVVNVDHPNLYFVGIVDPFGTYPAIVDLQARMAVGVIAGRHALPPAEQMRSKMARHERKMRKMLRDDSDRPMVREKFYRYQHRLRRFLRRRAIRA